MEITLTVERQTWSRPEAVCQFDELSPNVLHNQIIRATAGLITRAPSINSDLKDRLRTTYGSLSGIYTVQVTETSFRGVQPLLFICRLPSAILAGNEP
jgi:5-methylcytosine-specific restriction enzyme subunit McrC